MEDLILMSRREFVKSAALTATLPLAAAEPLDTAELRWLEGVPKFVPGTVWGVPWPRGIHKPTTAFALSDGTPLQSWPLATWPDGSLKWSGHAVGVLENASATLQLVPGQVSAAPRQTVTVTETTDEVLIETGTIRARVPKRGDVLITAIERDGKAIVQSAQLVSLHCDAPELAEDGGTVRQTKRVGVIEKLTVEQRGPVRAVIKIEGKHGSWLPFVMRLYFFAGSECIRFVHSFVFDGDESKDFLSGLGVRFVVPQSEPLHDRHVRFSGEASGLFAEAVRPLTGLRRDPGQAARANQIAGKPAGEVAGVVARNIERIPAWSDFTLSQLTADGFEIRKRTKPGHAWIRAGAGKRAGGVVSLGGVVLGLRDFWQRHPVQLDIRNAASDKATVTAWLYAPDAGPMDLRFYHDGLGMETHPHELEGLDVTYEDYEKGWGSPYGVARTSELFLWALDATPSRERLNTLTEVVRKPPQLAAAPAHLHAAGVFGDWDLPDRSTATRKAIEDQLDYLLETYLRQVEQRRWYGFWDFGDVMHSYDSDRHEWKYDIGGFAWANSELSPDLWLWTSFLRTGGAEIFRLAEAMTRHTSEVDVHHIGRFAGFGSRHNVQHWGDSSKQPRVSTAAYKRFFYYLTADERTGDLMRDLVDSDQRLLTVKIGRKLAPGDSPQAPDPTHAANIVQMSFGTEWCSLAAAWLTEWERTSDSRWRERLLAGMQSIGALPQGWLAGGSGFDLATKRFVGPGNKLSFSHLNVVFGGIEINSELLSLLTVPEYEKTWLEYCIQYNIQTRPLNLGESHSRATAYAAKRKGDKTLAERAWKEFFSGAAGLGVRTDLVFTRISGPAVLNPVDEGFGLSTNAASQWGLAAIQNLALIGEYLPTELPAAPRRRRER
ncbi:Tat pathway signal sequence domain protein [Armatimonas sp.]|uniref:exo-rhamnogalacturonan lyase family protein n=1 Tax=Armatimonas sp. TaxID=1872638 RepID=UPI0037504DE0